MTFGLHVSAIVKNLGFECLSDSPAECSHIQECLLLYMASKFLFAII